MPLFSALVASLFGGFVAFLLRFMGLQAAQRLAVYAMYITVTTAFLVAVFVCLSSLYGGLAGLISGGGGGGGGSWFRYFFMGVGMFIPSNAASVMACVASVWMGTSIYKVQKQGFQHWGG